MNNGIRWASSELFQPLISGSVWSWNSMLAWVCGNVSVWKGSEKNSSLFLRLPENRL